MFGGWAVDFHAGSVARPHDDIDLAEQPVLDTVPFEQLVNPSQRNELLRRAAHYEPGIVCSSRPTPPMFEVASPVNVWLKIQVVARMLRSVPDQGIIAPSTDIVCRPDTHGRRR